MTISERKGQFVVFDLDDTLYFEREYQNSGFAEICARIKELYGRDLFSECVALLSAGCDDVIGELCRRAGLPASMKESLLWMYRLHKPRIALREGAGEIIETLEQVSAGVAILTDGRSLTQRGKIQALGLERIRAYVSEETGARKPDITGFVQIARDFPATRYIYVADNPAKDFIAPNSLGWRTEGVRGTADNVYSQDCRKLTSNYHPHVWIDALSELLSAI